MIKKLREWWADDWHILPRLCRDLYYWMKGKTWTRVDCTIVTYDEASGTEHLDTVRMPFRMLPPEALHVAWGGYRKFVLDSDGQGEWPAPGSMDAHGLYLWTVSDAIENALAKKKSSIWDAIDARTLGIVAGAIAAIVVAYWWVVLR